MSPVKSVGLSSDHPFPGLRPYGWEDRNYFFGREEQVSVLYRLLDFNRFIAVVGGSGSGKSSLVRAGLRPLLDEESQDPVGGSWCIVEMRPGDHPIHALAVALSAVNADSRTPVRLEAIESTLRESSFGILNARRQLPLKETETLLIIVDQFEELFRYAYAVSGQANDPERRSEANDFVRKLLETTRSPEHRVKIVITMRSDFIGECSQFEGLSEAVSASQFLVPAATRHQREAMILRPIEKAGGSIEEILVERILNDADDTLDQLPVFQHCLMRLWWRASIDRAHDDAGVQPHLRNDHYLAINKVAGALSQHADEVMGSLPGREREVELIFRALSKVDSQGRAIRRALPFRRLLEETGVDESALREVLDRFRADDCSFLMPSQTTEATLSDDAVIDVGHEALLRQWDRISKREFTGEQGEKQEGGWLAIEVRDGERYQWLLGLITSRGYRATIPMNLVADYIAWWNSQRRTPAWAERYGGHYDHVVQLLKDSDEKFRAEDERQRVEKERQRVSRRLRVILVASFVSALIVGGITVTYLYIQADSAKRNADQERQFLTDQIAQQIYDDGANFALMPGGQRLIRNMIESEQTFATQYRAFLTNRGLAQSGLEKLQLATTILRAQRDLTAGNTMLAGSNITLAAKRLDQIIHDSGVGGDTAISFKIINADILVQSAQIGRWSDSFVASYLQLRGAQKLLKNVGANPRHLREQDDALFNRMTVISQLYFDFDLYLLDNVVSRIGDAGQVKDLKLQAKAHFLDLWQLWWHDANRRNLLALLFGSREYFDNPCAQKEPAPGQKGLTQGERARERAEIFARTADYCVLVGNHDRAEALYRKAQSILLPGPEVAHSDSQEVQPAEPSYSRTVVLSNYYQYKEALGWIKRSRQERTREAQINAATHAIDLLDKVQTYYENLANENSDVFYWPIVKGWVELAKGDAFMELGQYPNAMAAYQNVYDISKDWENKRKKHQQSSLRNIGRDIDGGILKTENVARKTELDDEIELQERPQLEDRNPRPYRERAIAEFAYAAAATANNRPDLAGNAYRTASQAAADARERGDKLIDGLEAKIKAVGAETHARSDQ